MFSFSKNVASQYIAREYFENVFSWGSDIEKKEKEVSFQIVRFVRR